MEKKVYEKPTLVSQPVVLGVFGDYNTSGGKDGDGDSLPGPFPGDLGQDRHKY